MKREDIQKPLPILAASVMLAVALWLWWICMGMSWAHSRMAAKATQVSTSVSQPLNTSKIPNADLEAKSSVKQPINTEPLPNADLEAKSRERFFAEMGQTGDAFGGLNALLTAIAGALVAWAGFMQYQTLATARVVAEEERKHRKRQEFESLFFQLLDLSTRITEKIERSISAVSSEAIGGSSDTRVGARALDSYAHLIAREVTPPSNPSEDLSTNTLLLRYLVQSYFRSVYKKKPSTFGPYFRILFQMFKHISESDLPLKDQITFSNIARGQISDGAVLLLALNGVTPNGHKFAPLIEKFGLLEHLHGKHRRKYEPALRLAYRPRAFMGSTERAKPENAWIPDPLLSKEHFADIQTKNIEEGDDS
jgi:hypothetical protein